MDLYEIEQRWKSQTTYGTLTVWYLEDIQWLISRVKELEAELSKWESHHPDSDLQEMKEQSEQPSLSAKQAYINALEWHNKHLAADNARLRDAIKNHRDKSPVEDVKEDGTPIYYFDDAELYAVLDQITST